MFLKNVRLFTLILGFSISLLNNAQKVDAYTFQNIKNFKTTTTGHAICGLTADSNNFWLATAESKIYKISREKEIIIDSLSISVTYITGISLVGNVLYGVDVENKMLCKIDTSTGNIIKQTKLPFGTISGSPAGMDWDGEYLYINHINSTDSVYVLDTTGAKIDGWISPVSTPTGILKDLNSYWYIDSEELKIRAFNAMSTIQEKEIAVPGGGFPTGLVFGDHSIWLADNANDALYKIDTSSGAVLDTIILCQTIADSISYDTTNQDTTSYDTNNVFLMNEDESLKVTSKN